MLTPKFLVKDPTSKSTAYLLYLFNEKEEWCKIILASHTQYDAYLPENTTIPRDDEKPYLDFFCRIVQYVYSEVHEQRIIVLGGTYDRQTILDAYVRSLEAKQDGI